MLKKLFTKYFLEVVPSIVATVVGAYIVTHYINAKSEPDKPQAAVAAPAETSKNVVPPAQKADDAADKAVKADAAKAEAAKAEAAKSEVARLKAEKLAAEKAAAERAATDRAEAARKAAEKVAAEKLAAEKLASERAAAEKREKTVAKSAPVSQPPAETSSAPDDKRDANDLARAAIDRLRSAEPRQSELQQAPEAARLQEQPRPLDRIQERAKVNSVVYAPPPPSPPVIQQLPPAVTVAPPPSEAAIVPPPPVSPAPSASVARVDDPSRPTPPADIPSRPLDLHADGGRKSVAEDVVSAAKSVFQAVVPR